MCILSCPTSSIANCKTCTYIADNFWLTYVLGCTVRKTLNCVRVLFRRNLSDRKLSVNYIGIMIISGSSGTPEKWDAPSGQKILLMTDRRKVLLSFTRIEQLFLIGYVFPQQDTIWTYSCTHAMSPVAAKMYASNRFLVACCPRATVRKTDNADQQKKRKENKSPYERSKIPMYLRVFLRNILYNFKCTAFII